MSMRKLWPGVTLVLLVAGYGGLRFHDLPANMVTHWDLSGGGDNASSRWWGVLALPLIALGTAFLLGVVPRIDPKRHSFAQHADAYWFLANCIVTFFAFMHLVMLGTNLGWAVPVGIATGCGVGALLMVLGNYLSRIRQNWFLGIRTPWTLSSEKSWRETHRLGGRLFVAGGLLLILATLFSGSLPSWALITGVAVPAVVLVIYSYVIWNRDPSTKAGA
jgi:uncharacterized membrane protein